MRLQDDGLRVELSGSCSVTVATVVTEHASICWVILSAAARLSCVMPRCSLHCDPCTARYIPTPLQTPVKACTFLMFPPILLLLVHRMFLAAAQTPTSGCGPIAQWLQTSNLPSACGYAMHTCTIQPSTTLLAPAPCHQSWLPAAESPIPLTTCTTA